MKSNRIKPVLIYITGAIAVICLVLRELLYQQPPTPPSFDDTQPQTTLKSSEVEAHPSNYNLSEPKKREQGERITQQVSVKKKKINRTKPYSKQQEAKQDPKKEPQTKTNPTKSNQKKNHDKNKASLRVPIQAKVQVPIASKDDPDSFAACLLLMDDNHFLVEWIAYHYHVLPLRRLIVYTDPKSLTTPQPILDRWKDRIQITLFNEDDVFPEGFPARITNPLDIHRRRQPRFQKKCMSQLFQEGRGWTLFADVDEYIMINHDHLRFNTTTDSNSTSITNTSNYPLQYFANTNLTIPTQQEPGSVLKFLQQGLPVFIQNVPTRYTHPCIALSRKHFGTVEVNDTAIHSKNNNNKHNEPKTDEDDSTTTTTVFGFWNRNYFQTLHWRVWGLPDERPKPGKSIVNLAQLTSHDLKGKTDVHRPIKNRTICKHRAMYKKPQDSLFVIHHYQGTLEQMLFRGADARAAGTNNNNNNNKTIGEGNGTAYRIQRFYNAKNYSAFLESTTIQSWLSGFVQSVGLDEAKRLLEHVGQPYQAATFLSDPLPQQ